MHMDSYVLAGILGVSVLFAGVDVITKSLDEKYKPAKQLSVHAYQTDISHGISMAGPFLSKIRVTPNATRMLTATADLNTQSEKYCTSLPPQEETYCNMSRVANMYLGDIHSSWSVLGTQSTYTLVKHIFCILLTFSLFWMVEHLIYTEDNYFRKNHKQVRVVVLICAIIIFVGNVIFDIQEDMYKVDAVAIGSITTGISFCLVCLLVICFTHLHDPDGAVAPAADAAGGGVASALEGASETDPLTGTAAGIFHFSLWSGQTPTVRTTDEDRYRRLEDMYLNIHVSYLVLLLMPLFVILALTTEHEVVVDVHVQLIFFSSVFFAVLDIFQTRVMSVLASLTQSGHMTVSTPVGMVKFFVVLAFILCKLLVLVPAWQLLFKYYTPDGSVSYFLVVWQVVLFSTASAVDLLYVSDFFDSANSEGAKVLPDTRSPEKSHVMYKQLSLGFYLIASSVTVLYV
jgi:hypothetical protein